MCSCLQADMYFIVCRVQGEGHDSWSYTKGGTEVPEKKATGWWEEGEGQGISTCPQTKYSKIWPHTVREANNLTVSGTGWVGEYLYATAKK